MARTESYTDTPVGHRRGVAGMSRNPTTASVVVPVFRDPIRATEAIVALLDQSMPTGIALDVVVVDDGSGDGTAERLSHINDPRVRLLALPENVGRSAARNAGAEAARGAIVVFMDCDCLPTSNGFIAAHIEALQSAVASTGRVTGDGAGFWHRYQHDASLRRERQHAAGAAYSGSSQNLAVRAETFLAVGGFDTGYRHYGFEDRDLLLRIAREGRVVWTPAAMVRHRDALSMGEVARKMGEAGRLSSTRFLQAHPAAYAALGYARLDARRNRATLIASHAVAPLLPFIARVVDASLASPIPHVAKAWAVRVTTALAYWCGTGASEEARAPKR
jgi:glycosyltransferase involved in cell wall biosynthesis